MEVEAALPAEVSVIRPRRLGTDHPLAQIIREAGAVDLDQCLECGKCAGGCSTTELFDYTPRKIVQLVKMGAEDTLLRMEALSLCVGCRLCVERCPVGIDVATIIDVLRQRASERGIPLARPNVEVFDKLFLQSVHDRGRVSELRLMLRYNFRTGGNTDQAELGLKLLRRGKLRLLAAHVRDRKSVKRLFGGEPRS
jgi:heterodisulfide reductase subunit C2